MKQFITILLISLCLSHFSMGRLSKECIDNDADCTLIDFNTKNHSVDDNSAIVCDAEAVMGQFGEAEGAKCFGIFDGCFGKGNDEKNQVDCGDGTTATLTADACQDNPLANQDADGCVAVVCSAETTCDTAKDDADTPVDCCTAPDAATILAACKAWQDSLHCAPSAFKIALWIAIIALLSVTIACCYVRGKQGSAVRAGGYNPLGQAHGRRGRVSRTQF